MLGVANSRLHHDDESLAGFRKAATLSPQQEEHWLNLTREQMEFKRLAEATASVQEGLQANPKSYALHLRLGAAYFAGGRYPEAEQSFRELVAAGDPLPTSSIGLAQVLLRTGRAPEAYSVLADAERRLGPQFLIVYFEGLALDRAAKRADALAAFRRAVQINPKSPEAHLGLGKTSLALGSAKEAVDELQKVLQLDPGNRPARRLLSQAYNRLADHENATKYASGEVVAEPEPSNNLVGDFVLPEWQQPTAQ
jgi:tetratricopeptide (TPR) repeat protein